MIFRDRRDAGERLGAALKERGFQGPVVLGIPRGGVPVAAEVARALDGELAVVVARKLGAPGNPELAVGAVTATGVAYVNTAVAKAAGADKAYIEAEKKRQAEEARRRERLFDSHRRPPLTGRTVIVVDDGIATGATAIAAVRSVKAEGAARVVLAIPVGPPEMVQLLRSEADEVVCLHEDAGFWAVGQYYWDFSQVSDEEVQATLSAFAPTEPAPAARRVEFRRNGVRLVGVLSTPGGRGPFPLVIFVHGLGSGKDSPRNVVVAEHLVDAGIAALLFDLSGHGESSADPRDGVEAYVDDLAAAYAWALRQPQVRPDAIGVAGSSLGAVVALRALAARRVQPRTLVLRAPPLTEEDVCAVSVPALVILGSEDPLLPQVRRIAAARRQLTLSLVPGAGHLFEEPGTLEQAVERTVTWFRTHLGAAPEARPPRQAAG